MHHISTMAAVLWLLLGAAQAQTCDNGNLPDNPTTIYDVHDDGTVTDRRTGLMWKQCAEGQGSPSCSGTPATMDWAVALQYAQGHSFAGHSDWRLPNLRELRSLVEHCRLEPAINTAVFANAPWNPGDQGGTWTSTPDLQDAGGTWYVGFHAGLQGTISRTGTQAVRLVRGGVGAVPPPPPPPPPPVDGVCGSSDGQHLSVAPQVDLCRVGVASLVTGRGPWSWVCHGLNGGADAMCSASLADDDGLKLAEGPNQGQSLLLDMLPSQGGWKLAAAATYRAKDLGEPPPGMHLLHGVVSVALHQGMPGSTAQVVLTYPEILPPDAVYYKYGPTLARRQAHWYPFSGAQIAGNTVTLTLTDGEDGDDDLAPNGVISDPGGPAVPYGDGPTPPPAPVSPDNAQAIPTLGQWGGLLLLGLMVLLGLRRLEGQMLVRSGWLKK